MVTIRAAKLLIVGLLAVTIVTSVVSLPVRIGFLNYLTLHPTHDRSMTTEQASSGKIMYAALVILQVVILGSAVFATLRHRFVLKMVCSVSLTIWSVCLVVEEMSAMDITLLILTILSSASLMAFSIVIRRKETRSLSIVDEDVYIEESLPEVY